MDEAEKKQYVTVVCQRFDNGVDCPKALHWTDGRIFEISHALQITYPEIEGFEDVLYSVLISGRQKFLFREGDD